MISYKEKVKCADLRSFFSPKSSAKELVGASSRGSCNPDSALERVGSPTQRFSLRPSPRDVPLTMVRETSRDAYRKLLEEGKADTQTKRVFAALVAHPAGLTYNELERLTGIRINAICGRMAELRRVELSDGDLLVESVCVREGAAGVQNMVWRVNPLWRNPSRRVM